MCLSIFKSVCVWREAVLSGSVCVCLSACVSVAFGVVSEPSLGAAGLPLCFICTASQPSSRCHGDGWHQQQRCGSGRSHLFAVQRRGDGRRRERSGRDRPVATATQLCWFCYTVFPVCPGGEGLWWDGWGVCVCVCVCVGVWRWWARGFQTSPDTDRSLVSTTSNIPHPLLVSSFLSFPSSVQPSFFLSLLSFPFLSSPLLLFLFFPQPGPFLLPTPLLISPLLLNYFLLFSAHLSSPSSPLFSPSPLLSHLPTPFFCLIFPPSLHQSTADVLLARHASKLLSSEREREREGGEGRNARSSWDQTAHFLNGFHFYYYIFLSSYGWK